MKPRTKPLEKQFDFASLSFPRYLSTLPTGDIKTRIKRYTDNPCGPYYVYGLPVTSDKNAQVKGEYHSDKRLFGMRWNWCDDVCKSIRHTGWFTDENGDGEPIRGIVLRLPKGRGFLAGYSMGEGMICAIDYSYIYPDEIGAAFCADSMAENEAEKEREYRQENEEDF